MPKIGKQKYSKSLYLGRQFENHVRTIRFDISEWVNEFGEGTVELLHKRHEDTVPYSVPFSRVNDEGNENNLIGTYVLWNVSSVDTAQAFSDGQAELRYYAENADNYLLKSEIYRTVVSESLGTPLPEEDWYKSLVSKLDSIDNIVSEVTAIRDEILSGGTGGVITENNYTTAEKNKLAGIEDGAEVNIIVSVSVNDSPVDIVDKNVALRIPTKVSELTNDSGYLTEHQDISGKVDKVSGKGLSTNDYTDADKAKVAAALTEHQDISGKVDKVSGKGLSTNDYTDADKNKLSGIPADANHTTIDVTLSNAGQAADAKTTGDSLSALQSLISRMEIYCEASGNPATFYDADAANVKALSVTLTPTQSGSGNPYPPGGGKNLFNYDAWKNLNIVNGTAVFENNGVTLTANTIDCYTAYANGVYPTNARIPVSEGETIILSLEYGTNTRGEIMFFPNGTTNGLVYSSEGDTSLAYTVPSGVTYVTFRVGFKGQAGNTISFRNIMVRRGSDTDPTFEPYSNIRPISGVSSVSATRTGENGANPQTVTVQLTDGSNPLTVYGGTLNVTTGALTVTHANIASYNGETLPGRWISDRDVYASGTTPTTGAQVVYELATPLTYQLTPQQLATLAGYNSVTTDAGSISVTYRANVSFA